MAQVLYEVRDKLARITLNRPEKRNAINGAMSARLFALFAEMARDPQVWGCLITGTGGAFSSGHDLAEPPPEGGEALRHRPVSDLYQVIMEMDKPCFAAINGVCLAGGAGIALSCDVRVMSEEAQLGWPQVMRGISSVSGPILLARLLPFNLAHYHLFTGEFIDAATALRLGLVNKVAPAESVLEETERIARRVLANAPLAVRAIKELTVRARDMTMEDALRFGDVMLQRLLETEDAGEGLRAFREKRPPRFRGR